MMNVMQITLTTTDANDTIRVPLGVDLVHISLRSHSVAAPYQTLNLL